MFLNKLMGILSAGGSDIEGCFNRKWDNGYIGRFFPYGGLGIVFVLMTVSIFSVPLTFAQEQCVLKMGYRTNAREPLINKSPDNNGLYYSLYSAAAQRLGCKLEVVRKPKEEIIEDLKIGKIDFYPGFNFTTKRAGYTYYIENGLPGGDIGISLEELQDITNLTQLKDGNYVLINSAGNPKFIEGVREHEVAELGVEEAIKLIQNKVGDFFIYNKSTLLYYLKKSGVKGLKIHPRCCGGVMPLYLGFSMKSVHFKAVQNPGYHPEKPVSKENFPLKAASDCLAYRLSKELEKMKASGEIGRLYLKYYGYQGNCM